MSFLYKIISEYSKENDTLTDTGASGKITSLKGYLDSIDEIIFDVVNSKVLELLTLNSIDLVSDEYIRYLAYYLGYVWNDNIDFDFQRTLLKSILDVYKRKGTRFAFHFNIYQLDPTVSLYEPYKDLFILNQSTVNKDHLPSHDYYSYGILVIRLNKYNKDISDIIEYIRPAGWKIVIEFNYGLFYSFHDKVLSEARTRLLNSTTPIDYDYSFFDTTINNYKSIVNSKYPITASMTLAVTRASDALVDNLKKYVEPKYVITIDKIYLTATQVYTQDTDYTVTYSDSNIVIRWISTNKPTADATYYVDYIKNVKIEAADFIAVDTVIQEQLKTESLNDRYDYDEFGNPYRPDMMTDDEYDRQYTNSLVYINGKFMPITMVGRTFMSGIYQPPVYYVDNQEARYELSQLKQWDYRSLNDFTKISNTSFSIRYDHTQVYKTGANIKFSNSITGYINEASYDKTTDYTTISFIFNVTGATLATWYPTAFFDYEVITPKSIRLKGDCSKLYNKTDTLFFDNIASPLTSSITVISSSYNSNSKITTCVVTGNLPYNAYSVYVYSSIITDGDIVYQKDNSKVYLVIDSTKLNMASGYKQTNSSLDQILTTSSFIPDKSALFNLTNFDDIKAHILYETEDEDFTLYRHSLCYSDYYLDSGRIFVSGGTKIFVVPYGVSSVTITTCGSGGGSSDTREVAGNKYIAVGGGGGAVKYHYNLDVSTGDSITLTAGTGGLRNRDGEESYAAIRRVGYDSKTKLSATVSAGGKAPLTLDSTYINPIGTNGVSWYGGEGGGGNGGAGGSLWTINNNLVVNRPIASYTKYTTIYRGTVFTMPADYEVTAITLIYSGAIEYATYIEYVKNTDYVFDLDNSTITWLETGTHPTGDYYIDFEYIDTTETAKTQVVTTNSKLVNFVYSDYGSSGVLSGGKTVISTGLICGGGGSFGNGAGAYTTAGYGGGGCASVDDGKGGPGFALLEYNVNTTANPNYLEISPATLSLNIGDSYQMTYTVSPEADWTVLWSSSNTAIATVDSNGLVKAKSAGNVNITSTIGTVSSTSALVVSQVYISSITAKLLSSTDKKIAMGSLDRIIVNYYPTNATYQSVSYTSSNSSIATVNNNGIITGVSQGEVSITITATDGSNVSVILPVSIIPVYITNLDILGDSSMYLGKTIKLYPTVLPRNATYQTTINYSSSNTDIATVEADGKYGMVTAHALGTVNITGETADGSNITALHKLTVLSPILCTDLSLSGVGTMTVGEVQKLAGVFTPSNTSTTDLTFESNNYNVATVDSDGNVTALDAGNVSITATTIDGTNISATFAIAINS